MRARWWCLLVLAVGCTCRKPAAPEARYAKFDVHVHASPAAVPRLVDLMDAQGVERAVNLSGGWPGEGLDAALAAAAATKGRVVVFANPPLELLAEGVPMSLLVGQLEDAKRRGARGVKFYKALGLGYRDETGALLAVDDARLDPLFERAGELGLPVSIHTGDPVAFWRAPDAQNERFDELAAHPGWSYFGRDAPTWEALFEAYQRRVARHPRTTFIGVHFGNAPEFPARVSAMLDANPNLYVDTAARVPELGRRAALVRALILRHPTRVLFGTDLGVGEQPGQLMLGSTGLTPPGPADVKHFFTSTWRFFETRDEGFAHPTPIQGRWTISGLGLPPEVLRQVYSQNAERLLGL